jgi:hypothetical protein
MPVAMVDTTTALVTAAGGAIVFVAVVGGACAEA